MRGSAPAELYAGVLLRRSPVGKLRAIVELRAYSFFCAELVLSSALFPFVICERASVSRVFVVAIYNPTECGDLRPNESDDVLRRQKEEVSVAALNVRDDMDLEFEFGSNWSGIWTWIWYFELDFGFCIELDFLRPPTTTPATANVTPS